MRYFVFSSIGLFQINFYLVIANKNGRHRLLDSRP
jgi:hypothetical protein